MRRKVIIMTGMACLMAILVACNGVEAGENRPASEETNDSQTRPSVVTITPAETTATTESNAVSPAEASTTPTEEVAVTGEFESENEEVTVARQPAAQIALPPPQNQLSAGQYLWSQLLPRDAIYPVYEPRFAPAEDAPYADDELVVGVEINGEAKAYAIGPLNSREMVNDTLGGVPILVTW